MKSKRTQVSRKYGKGICKFRQDKKLCSVVIAAFIHPSIKGLKPFNFQGLLTNENSKSKLARLSVVLPHAISTEQKYVHGLV